MGDYAISRRPLHPRMQVLQAPPKARATIAVVASLLAIGFVTLMISSVSDHPDFVAAEVEVGQERDPTALVADPTALSGADRFAEPAKAVTASCQEKESFQGRRGCEHIEPHGKELD